MAGSDHAPELRGEGFHHTAFGTRESPALENLLEQRDLFRTEVSSRPVLIRWQPTVHLLTLQSGELLSDSPAQRSRPPQEQQRGRPKLRARNMRSILSKWFATMVVAQMTGRQRSLCGFDTTECERNSEVCSKAPVKETNINGPEYFCIRRLHVS